MLQRIGWRSGQDISPVFTLNLDKTTSIVVHDLYLCSFLTHRLPIVKGDLTHTTCYEEKLSTSAPFPFSSSSFSPPSSFYSLSGV